MAVYIGDIYTSRRVTLPGGGGVVSNHSNHSLDQDIDVLNSKLLLC